MKFFLLTLLTACYYGLQAQLTLDHIAFTPMHQVEIPSMGPNDVKRDAAESTAPRDEVNMMSQPKVGFKNLYCPAFFCRVEDAIAKSSKVNFKFRLGSVNYVDALEGKGYFEATSNSRATDLQISRTK